MVMETNKPRNGTQVEIKVNGEKYPSINAAAFELGVSRELIQKHYRKMKESNKKLLSFSARVEKEFIIEL